MWACMTADNVTRFARVDFRSDERVFGIKDEDRFLHINTAVTDGTLRRHVAHEVHYCLRMGGPGYGRSLGEALVSEGLAGRFVAKLFGNAPEPWECAIDAAALKPLPRSCDAQLDEL